MVYLKGLYLYLALEFYLFMIYYLHSADFRKGLRQLSSSVKPILNHFPSLPPLPATSDFNEVVFPVRSINWDSCGPGIPEPQRQCFCRDHDLWFAARQRRKSWQNFPGHPLWCPSPLRGMARVWGPPGQQRLHTLCGGS